MANLDRLIQSITHIFKAFAYVVANPFVWKYIVIAILTNCVVFIISIIFVTSFVNSVVSDLVFRLNVQFLIDNSGIVGIFSFLLSLIFSVLIFTTLSSIANSPVYAHLAENIANREGIPVLIRRNLIQEIFYSLGFEFKKLSLNLLILLISLPLHFVPVVGSIIYFVLNISQIIIITGLDLFEPILSKQNLKFRSKISIVLSRPFLFWPYLLICGLLSSIPVVNIFVIPICIVGAIKLYNEK